MQEQQALGEGWRALAAVVQQELVKSSNSVCRPAGKLKQATQQAERTVEAVGEETARAVGGAQSHDGQHLGWCACEGHGRAVDWSLHSSRVQVCKLAKAETREFHQLHAGLARCGCAADCCRAGGSPGERPACRLQWRTDPERPCCRSPCSPGWRWPAWTISAPERPAAQQGKPALRTHLYEGTHGDVVWERHVLLGEEQRVDDACVQHSFELSSRDTRLRGAGEQSKLSQGGACRCGRPPPEQCRRPR